MALSDTPDHQPVEGAKGTISISSPRARWYAVHWIVAGTTRHDPEGGAMRTRPGFASRLRIGALGAAVLAVLLCVVPADVPAQEPHGVNTSTMEALAHTRINAHRLDEGLAPLEYDAGIAAASRRHSAAMAAGRVPTGHEGFEARESRIAEAIPLSGMAENVGFNTYPADRTVPAAVSGWLASRGHRANIEGDYDVTGIGIARGPQGAWYYTQIFVKRGRSRAPRPGS